MNRREALKRVGVLLGGALSAPTVAGVLGGCRAAQEWDPVFLKGGLDELVASIAEQIVPTTDTPGAREAGVNRFIDRMLAEWYPDDYRKAFTDGLAEVDRRAREAGAPFVDLEPERRRGVLASMDEETFPSARQQAAGLQAVIEEARERAGASRPDGGPVVRADIANEGILFGQPPHFIRLMKELTLLGYYTSEVGATEELKYIAVPGRWDACVPFSEVGRAWAV